MPKTTYQRSSERLAESLGRRRRQPRGHEGSRVGPRRPLGGRQPRDVGEELVGRLAEGQRAKASFNLGERRESRSVARRDDNDTSKCEAEMLV